MSIMRIATLIAAAGLAAPALAQDSVSATGGLPGDALNPTDLNAQRTSYVARLGFGSSYRNWPRTRFGIVPLIKSSKTSTGFFGSLTSGFSLSADLIDGNVNGPYPVWNQSGFGVNAAENLAPQNFIGPANLLGTKQFAATVAEFSTTDGGASYNGVISAIVNYDPSNGSNLLVDRVVSAGNITDTTASLDNSAQLGMGTIDASGNVYIRADDFGIAGLPAVFGQNIFRVDNASRGAVLNQLAVSEDAAALTHIVDNDGTTHIVPNHMPESIAGGNGLYVGNTFNADVRVGANSVTAINPVPGGAGGTRGSLAGSTLTFPITGGNATYGQFTQDAAGLTNGITIFGVDTAGAITGSVQTTVPTSITDDSTGFVFNAPSVELIHYFSQTPFRGGNGQLAIGFDDVTGEGLLAAPIADIGGSINDDNPINAIAVARFDPATGAVNDWDLAAWIDPFLGSEQPILGDFGLDGIAFTNDLGENDGVIDANDAPIGTITPLFNVPGAPFGPSISNPAFDSKGNIYFVSSVALNKSDPATGQPFTDFDSGLIRANYNYQTGGYDLELLLELGQTFAGANSDTRYQIQFLGVADSNSISSGTVFSSAGSEYAFGGIDPTTIGNRDPRALGGMTFTAEIVYDVDNDGDFNDDPVADPGTLDESYNALLYMGFNPDVADVTTSGATLPGQPGFGVADNQVDLDDLGFFLNFWAAGDQIADRTTTGATLPGQPGFGLVDGVVDLDDLGFFLSEWLDGTN